MTIFYNELKRGYKNILVWGISIAFILSLCLLLFPDIQEQMTSMSSIFSKFGVFTSAFGLDKLDMGTLMGYYGVECGQILGIGGAFYAGFLGGNMLSKEEEKKTAEFLLTHPVKRSVVIINKLVSSICQIVIVNAIIVICVLLSSAVIREKIDMHSFFLLHLAHILLQIQIFLFCMGISGILNRGGGGMGIGVACAFYFLSMVSKLTTQTEGLGYLTPFTYADSSYIIPYHQIQVDCVLYGFLIAGIMFGIGALTFCRKDIFT